MLINYITRIFLLFLTGTGKTKTGAYLAYFFSQMNRSLPCDLRSGMTPKILYCGPSNKSVDVIAGMDEA